MMAAARRRLLPALGIGRALVKLPQRTHLSADINPAFVAGNNMGQCEPLFLCTEYNGTNVGRACIRGGNVRLLEQRAKSAYMGKFRLAWKWGGWWLAWRMAWLEIEAASRVVRSAMR